MHQLTFNFLTWKTFMMQIINVYKYYQHFWELQSLEIQKYTDP